MAEGTFTWHLGGLKSRPGIPGTSEYGKNTDGRWAFRLLPSAKINTLTLTSSASNPASIFEALGHVFVVSGQRVYRMLLDRQIDALTLEGGQAFQIMALKREKLRIKDQIAWLASKLTPDIIS